LTGAENKLLWNIYSFCYDSLLKFKPYRSLLKELSCQANLQPGEVVLDIGCGTGNFEYLFGQEKTEIIGLDYCEQMLVRAKKKNNGSKFIMYNLLDYYLPFDNASIDKIISCNAIYNVKDLDKFFADVNRILKIKGEFIFTTSTSAGLKKIIKSQFEDNNADSLFSFFFALPKLIVVLLINVYIDHKFKSYFYSNETISSALNDKGFQIQSVKESYGGANSIFHAIKK
jgi:ubiquinone/menaquinone biosynthesis C-methylase UbiE